MRWGHTKQAFAFMFYVNNSISGWEGGVLIIIKCQVAFVICQVKFCAKSILFYLSGRRLPHSPRTHVIPYRVICVLCLFIHFLQASCFKKKVFGVRYSIQRTSLNEVH